MKYRKAIINDVPQILRIIKINNPCYDKQLAHREITEMFSKSLCKPTYIVAVEKNAIIAFAGYNSSWLDNAVFNIFWVNVHPEHKRKGIGSLLIKYIINKIKDEKDVKAKMILLSTKTSSFYKLLGFRQISPKYDKEYVLMSLKI